MAHPRLRPRERRRRAGPTVASEIGWSQRVEQCHFRRVWNVDFSPLASSNEEAFGSSDGRSCCLSPIRGGENEDTRNLGPRVTIVNDAHAQTLWHERIKAVVARSR